MGAAMTGALFTLLCADAKTVVIGEILARARAKGSGMMERQFIKES